MARTYQEARKLETGIGFQVALFKKLFILALAAQVIVFVIAFSFHSFTKEEKSFMYSQAKPAVMGCIFKKLGKEVSEESTERVEQAREIFFREATLPFYLSFLGYILPIAGFMWLKRRAQGKDETEENLKEYEKTVTNDSDNIVLGGYREGSHILIEKDEKFINAEHKREEKKLRNRNIVIEKEDELSHFFIAGQSGSGKTTFFYDLFRQLDGKRKIAHDNKMAFTQKFYNEDRDLIFNPMDERGLGWTIFNEINSIKDIENMANSIIPYVQGKSDENAIFKNSARDILIEALKHCYYRDKRTNKELYRVLSMGGQEMINETNSIVVEQLLGKAERTAASILIELRQHIRALQYLKDGDFSVREWVSDEENQQSIYITNRKDLEDMIAPILTLFIDTVSKSLLSLKDDLNRRVYFILDELLMLKRMDSLKDILTNGRSKGASCWVGIQDFLMLRGVYGESAGTLFSNCSTKVYFRLGDSETAEYASKFLGEIEKEQYDESLTLAESSEDGGLHTRKHITKEQVVDVNKLATLRDRECLIKPKSYQKYLKIKSYVADGLEDTSEAFIERDLESDIIAEMEEAEVRAQEAKEKKAKDAAGKQKKREEWKQHKQREKDALAALREDEAKLRELEEKEAQSEQ
jgi:uridine kinase